MGKVLVIDNDRFMLEVIEAVLDLAGRPTVSATSGDEGVAQFRNQKDDIDLVILDMRLSSAMEGADALRALRAIDPGVKVIIASAYSQSEVEEYLAEEQWDAILRKPYNMEQLLVTIEELNGGYGDSPAAGRTANDGPATNGRHKGWRWAGPSGPAGPTSP